MSKAKRTAVVEEIIDQLGTYMETYIERFKYGTDHPDLSPEDIEEVRKEIGFFVKRLPGNAWDIRLGNPNDPRGWATRKLIKKQRTAV